MTKTQRTVVLVLSIAFIVVGGIWFLISPNFGPVIAVLSGTIGLLKTWWPRINKRYAHKRLKGRISFDYSNNDGRYSIGQDEFLFETAWSKAGDTSIHIYNDPPSIDVLAVVKNKPQVSDITDASSFDFSSRVRTPEEGDIIILKNKYGNYAALKVMGIKDSSRSDTVDEVTFEYVINPDGKTDFR
jgi:hypothetical protein